MSIVYSTRYLKKITNGVKMYKIIVRIEFEDRQAGNIPFFTIIIFSEGKGNCIKKTSNVV